MPDDIRPTAVSLRAVSKRYRLYGNAMQMAADQLGYYRLRFWRKRPVFQEFEALHNISLDVRRGERVGIIGRNGAGKTTLLKLLTGNFAPTSGEVHVHGTVQALMQVGLGFHPEFTGYDNIRSALVYNGLTGAALEAALEEVVDFVELEQFLHQPMKTYSLGMGTRVQFATATAIQPDILIVDEILGAGDAYFSAKSAHRMRKLTYSGCTLLLVSHATDQILQFCERAIWLERGEVRVDGNALSVVRAYEEFIEKMRAHSEKRVTVPMVPAVPPATAAADFPTPRWQQEAMSEVLFNGVGPDEISRWPGEGGITVRRVALADAQGKERSVFESGEDIRVILSVSVAAKGTHPLRFALLFMTLTGTPITRILSPYFEIRATEPGEHEFLVAIPSNPFSPQEIIFSVAIFRNYEPLDPNGAVRYDLLSRSFKFRITGGTPNDPGIITVVAKWESIDRGGPSLRLRVQ
jgi:lipopolysaccharide transport system ATP-binding protein